MQKLDFELAKLNAANMLAQKEKAKGELRALVCMFTHDYEKYPEVNRLVESFIDELDAEAQL